MTIILHGPALQMTFFIAGLVLIAVAVFGKLKPR
jgi:hypothetical protein